VPEQSSLRLKNNFLLLFSELDINTKAAVFPD